MDGVLIIGVKPDPEIVCDGCDGPVLGSGYNCLICADYDLCETCEAGGVHPQHKMVRLPQRPDLSFPSAGESSYKVRMEHTPGAFGPPPGVACMRRIDAHPKDWTFTCSCRSLARSPTVCEHIGACLLVHFLITVD